MANASQDDGEQDGVGDACDLDDLDGDGVANAADNCPDRNNPDPQGDGQEGRCIYTPPAPVTPCLRHQDCTAGSGGFCDFARGFACAGSTSLDGDSVADADDNCVL